MSETSVPASVPMPTPINVDDFWTPLQKQVFASFADMIIPPLSDEEVSVLLSKLPPAVSERQREMLPEFAAKGFSSYPYLLDYAASQMHYSLSQNNVSSINMLLSALGTRPGCLALTGHIGPFHELDLATREQIFKGWTQSRISLLKKAASGLKGITLLVFYRFCQPAWEATGYPDGRPTDWSEKAENYTSPTKFHDFKFENYKISAQPADTEIIVDTEVLVVGSGSGGGVAGSYLAQRGVRTLIVDKGIYIKPEEVLGREDQSYPLLYDSWGILPSESSTINVLAGSTFGGGSTINWSASLKPRGFVRQAWANEYGVPYYNSPLFTSDLNAVCSRMGVAVAPIRHNVGNSLLALGSLRAGHPVAAVPQNSGGNTHFCGKCQLGCISGHKQGGVVSWLKDAAEAGAAFMTNCYVERILFDKNRKAIGALATVDGRKVKILASKGVVVSSGSMQTPALLQRCPELKYNKQIGQNLRLHPATVVTGYFNFPIKPWEGGLLTMVSNAAEMVDPAGWGCKIEVMASSPSLHAAFVNFSSAKEAKARMLKYAYSYTMVVICRDRDGGRIFVDEQGKVRFDYTISKFDQRSLVEGVLRAADAHMMAGAEEIATAQVGVPVFSATELTSVVPYVDQVDTETTQVPATFTPVHTVARNLNDPAYKAWQKKVVSVGAAPYMMAIGSAHQMASCRMGADPKRSALDPEGRVWGTKNLWVADASIMPESSGVNPMITTMAGARGVARNVARDIGVIVPAANELVQRDARL